MWARVSRFEEPKDRIDDDIREAGEVIQLFAKLPGSRGAYYLIDREHGRTMAVTLWEDEASMRASEEEAARVREESTARLGGRILSVERFEVALQPADVTPAKR